MLFIFNVLTIVKNITANDIPLFQFVDGFQYSKEKVEGTRIDGCYFSIIIDSSPYEIGNPPYLLGDIKISMWFVSKTQNPSFIGTISLENDIQCQDLIVQGKDAKNFFFTPKGIESYGKLNTALESASTLGEETYIFFQIYGIPRKINETSAPTIFNSEMAYRIYKGTFQKLDPRAEGFNIPSACDTIQAVKEGSLKPPEDETTSPKNDSHTAIHSESASRISEEVSQEPVPRAEGFNIHSARDTIQAVEEGVIKTSEDETTSSKNNVGKPEPEKTFWEKYNIYFFIGGGLLLIPPTIYAGYKVARRD